VDLYRSKSAIARGLEPIVERLERAGISPDAVTLAAIPVGIVAGALLLLSPTAPVVLLGVPVLAALRLVLNLLDGALARRTGRMHPRGELYNELGDRLADVAFLAPVAFLPGADLTTVLLGVAGAIFASFAGIVPRAAGGERIYRGILSKPGRMVLLSGFAVAAYVVGPGAWGPFGPVLLVGTILTAAERIIVGIRRLP
jgi:CDP-diacylglycerol---glycerol-3-phosphate 3-phosphatidyltransferase